ncbi:MAG: hypothetical protein B7Y41_04740 [Hydrogenophilales bacterium 28-61-23]|nr:MAG: hypothetical protein B7Y41_04740 [Hydrogenophilales bacterium 28-61-23]
MQILFASARPPYPYFLGGAARAAHMLLVRMAQMPNTFCSAVGSCEYAVSPWRRPATDDHAALGIHSIGPELDAVDCGYSVRLLPDFYTALADMVERTRPDLVWSQLEGALPVLQIAHRLGVTGLCYVHDAEFDVAEMRKIAALDCHLIASSAFLADKVWLATGRRASVVYPPAELYYDDVGDANGVVTMINPHPVKGLETLLGIASQRPGINFLLQESWKLDTDARAALDAHLAALPNVRFAERVSDMRSVYRQTRILLAPSRWEEGFGMVALEAASCGIPVIASRRGGLPEAVGEGGLLIDDYMNVDAWLAALDSMLNDAARYQAFSVRARQHAASEKFSPDALANLLAGIIATSPKQPGWLDRKLFTVKQRVRDWPLLGNLVGTSSH